MIGESTTLDSTWQQRYGDMIATSHKALSLVKPGQRLFIATGHAKMGMTHGPITGRLASECILDGKPSMDISSMRVGRF